ncbi:MAG TPA: ABC transporter ATP-binding protein [Planctomycetota bacterium]|nr:ABC transporter ATP-binding protein [Planctomycetota bacterium]
MVEAIVELEGVEKDYRSGDGALTVLKRVDLRIERGEFVGIVGASGSGKTTLMNILGCLDRPTRGRYVLHGEDVSALNDDRLSSVRNRSIGFVFQSFNLISQFTVIENVEVPLFYARLPRRERRRRALAVIESVGLGHRIDHVPAKLSGGECQRVAIARALVTEPALLLTDEPTGNLDSKNGDEVLRLFYDLHRSGRTLIMVTHNPEIARSLPRVVEMKDGYLAEQVREGSLS